MVDDVRMIDLSEIDDAFPIRDGDKPSFRDGQREAIEFIAKAFNSGKRFVILEGPTGSGKSVIGMTISELVDKSYYLTSTKILQDQLVKDFDGIVELRGRNSYPCSFYDRFGSKMVSRGIMKQSVIDALRVKGVDCDSGFCKSKVNGNAFKCGACFTSTGPVKNGTLHELPEGREYSTCDYYEQVYKAIASRKVVMNFSSFMFQTRTTSRFGVARDLLIIDECHIAESQIMDFVSLTISDTYLTKYNVFLPEFQTAHEYALFFIDCKLDELITQEIDSAIADDKVKYADDLKGILSSYNKFIDDIQLNNTNWVAEYEEIKTTGNRRVILKPVFISNFTEDILFKKGKQVLLMSATVLNVDMVAKSLGIDRSEIAAYRMKNRFPVKNRPIYLDTVGKLTGGKDGMRVWGPKLVAGVNKLVNKYKNQRGIIHTHNFAIQELLKTQCADDVASRFLHQQDFPNKKIMLEEHSRRSDSIIVAPAMHEGIDLYDDLSRFQLICKVPYPNHFDNKQLAKRVEIDRRFYSYITALKLVQSYGRSIRSNTDYADTYILDECIHKFLRDANDVNMLPVWFTEAIIE